MDSTPFDTPSTLPYRLPPFAEITDEHYRPAFLAGMREHESEVAAIRDDPEPATFQNTIAALERAGRLLHRVALVFYNKSSSDSSEATNALEEELAPMLAAHEDAIRLDAKLFHRITAVWEIRDDAGLDDEAKYLVERYHTEFTLAGAGLGDDDKSRLRDLNARLSTLTTRFEKNLLADTNDLALTIDDVADLEGLSEGEVAAAREAARMRGLTEGFVLSLVLPTSQPLLKSLARPEVRERLMAASRIRGSRPGDTDNRALVLEIARLRAERARLLGFDSHAAAVLADQTAKTPDAVSSMLSRLSAPATRNAAAEQSVLEDAARADGVSFSAADWPYYEERQRAKQFSVDTAAMKPYFEADRVLRDGVFFAATRLYGIRFTERPDLVAYHPDARVFEVTEDDGSPVGLYILDLYTRDSKRGGAWMNPLVEQNALFDDPAVVVNNLNVPKPPAGSPTLLSYDEVNTLFHEFGHALHGLLARVTYPKFSGTNVFRDFVEFPSQVNEMWMLWPEVLDNYAVHYETGERMPQELVDALNASTGYAEGFATSEYLAAATLDQAWHRIGADDEVGDVAGFERDALAAAGLNLPAVPPRYSSTYFAHVFSGGYDAGYYSYIWSEVLDADTVEWFHENGGLTRENGDRFRSRLLGVGGSTDPLAAYRGFRGRDAAIEPLLKRRNLDS
ncbi:peptidyl-dipeptidase Dcp [Paramicrobacterium humi]|uniref:Peptidyl-dipeptidase Dcp n=1 Tax=Paramicrobacterium humi TaxID=640635 RepID=A0A1H4Q6J5_9MICO|nr:M3 family metallopeptidase [Microbacterium humi]SEC15256.1 peptidyl-dipeptidase Dcp [Microbacterium humi]